MPKWRIGVCIKKVKLEGRPMQSLLNLLAADEKYEIVPFREQMIIEQDIDEWPICHILLTFHSSTFPISKVLSYIRLRKPFLPNDLGLGHLLLDRRLTLTILDAIDIPTPPKRIICNSSSTPLEYLSAKGSPVPEEVIEECIQNFALNLRDPTLFSSSSSSSMRVLNCGSIRKGDLTINRPFIEKPVDSNDHSLIIYYPDGSATKLHRKINNRCSTPLEGDDRNIRGANANLINNTTSYIYEEMLKSHDLTDIKLYAVGPSYVYAEKRRAPHIDGVVRRREDGLEEREVVEPTEEEKMIAKEVVMAFGQTVCGMDVVRVKDDTNGKIRSFLLDVNGWSFVKGDQGGCYVRRSAAILLETFNLFIASKVSPRLIPSPTSYKPQGEKDFFNTGKLRVHVSIFRHADRTPKNKMKFSFQNNEIWLSLRTTIIPCLKGESYNITPAPSTISDEREVTIRDGNEMLRIADEIEMNWKFLLPEKDKTDFEALLNKLRSNHLLPGTKLQIRSHSPLSKKISITLKWGGDLTHSGRIQSQLLGNHYQRELLSLNPEILNNLSVYTGTESRVVGSAENFSKALLNVAELPPSFLITKKEALDDSLVGKDVIEKVKRDLLCSFDPFVTKKLKELHYLLVLNKSTLLNENVDLQSHNHHHQHHHHHSCSQTDMKERWQAHFIKIESEPLITPSTLSDIHDSLKYDLLHHRDYFTSCDGIDSGNDIITQTTQATLERMVKLCDDLFNHITPHEYGATREERLKIGGEISGALLSLVVDSLEEGDQNQNPKSHSAFFFTKESHMMALLNIVQEIQFPCKGKKSSKNLFESSDFMDEMDYLSHIVFEIYDNCSVDFSNNDGDGDAVCVCDDLSSGSSIAIQPKDQGKLRKQKIRIGLSHGADHHHHHHNPSCQPALDNHLLPIKPIHWLSSPLDKDEVLDKFKQYLRS